MHALQLTGFHHLTAVTADARGNHAFFTQTLGMRLVKKTVNQDDVSAYHLFYADGRGSPGTDITFFDWPARPERRGTRAIARTGLRVGSADSLAYWAGRLRDRGVAHGPIADRDDRPTLDLEDPEGQRLSLVAEDGVEDAAGVAPGGGRPPPHPWEKSPVPAEHQIRGLGPVTLSVPDLGPTDQILTGLMGLRPVRQYAGRATDGGEGPATFHVYQAGATGPAAELHVAVEPGLPPTRHGAGGVHHVAFRVPTFAEYDQWASRLREAGVGSSGPVDRFYFKSLYFREPNGILFELATDGPGFAADEPMESLGQRLSLPPFLESRRGEIEAGLKPL